MKYGQQYADTLQGASSEFQQASIDYKQLKKSIKRIERELQAVGLNAETLKELLNAGEDEREGDSAEAGSGHGRLPSNGVKSTVKKSKSDGSLGRKTLKLSKEAQQRGKARRQARARAQYELAGTVENPQPRIKLVFSSASSDSDTESHDDKQASEREELYNRLKQHDSARIVEVSGSDEEPDTADTSEQELFDVPEVGATGSAADIEKRGLLSKMYGQGEMVPASQVTPPGSPTQSERLFTLDNPSSTTINARAANHGEEPEEGIVVLEGPEILLSDLDSEEQDLASSNGTTESQEESADDADAESETGESSELRVHKGLPRVPNGHINGTPDTLSSLMPPASTSRRRTHRHHRRREITIDLAYGTEFFHLLNQALSSLALLLSSSKADFVKRVTALSAAISASASPTTKKSDLYGWREVFSLWIEAQIFESENERSRGERSVEEVEKRLLWFVDQVGRRKCVKRMKSKDSRKALETFVELNQELLQLKRIGIANREAARKILKKHDKRLGLSASSDFPDFIQQHHLEFALPSPDFPSLPGSASSNGRSLVPSTSALARTAASNDLATTLIFTGLTTLPHVLLSSFTEILLPIIPQIDDYTCLICSDIAWRPIALDCGHRFCVRCLVKMQKRNQNACPACRAPVVLKANKDNLDQAMVRFQKVWFPKEVKAKEKDNTREMQQEYNEEMGLDAKCCVQ